MRTGRVPRREPWLRNRASAQRANIASVDPIWAELRQRGRGGRPQRAGARRLRLCDHPEQGPARGRRLPSPGAAAQPLRRRRRPDRRDVRAGAGRSSRARPRLPRRPGRRLRPRSRLQPLHRAAALLQGLPRARHAPLRPRAAEGGPARLRALPAEPELAHLRRRHQSGGQDRHRHHARPRHRHRHRRDGGGRRQLLASCRA